MCVCVCWHCGFNSEGLDQLLLQQAGSTSNNPLYGSLIDGVPLDDCKVPWVSPAHTVPQGLPDIRGQTFKPAAYTLEALTKLVNVDVDIDQQQLPTMDASSCRA